MYTSKNINDSISNDPRLHTPKKTAEGCGRGGGQAALMKQSPEYLV